MVRLSWKAMCLGLCKPRTQRESLAGRALASHLPKRPAQDPEGEVCASRWGVACASAGEENRVPITGGTGKKTQWVPMLGNQTALRSQHQAASWMDAAPTEKVRNRVRSQHHTTSVN